MTRKEAKIYIPAVHEALKQLGNSGARREVSELVAKNLGLSDAVLETALKGGASKFVNDVDWARKFLVITGYLEPARENQRGVWSLTEKGIKTSALNRSEVDEIIKQVATTKKQASPPKEAAGSGAQLVLRSRNKVCMRTA